MRRIFVVTGLFFLLAPILMAGGMVETKPAAVKVAPAWVHQQPADADGKSFFVAVGNDKAANEAVAQDAAALDLIGQINRYLGVTITSESTGTEVATANDYQATVLNVVRQSAGGEVAGLRIADRFVTKDNQGITIYLLGEYKTADLEREKAKRQAIEAENEAAIAVPESKGKDAESRSDFFGAARFYMQAAKAAAEPTIRNGDAKVTRNIQSANRVLGRVMLIKQSGQTAVMAKKPFDQDFVVKVQDNETGTAISGADIYASYKEYQANGKYSFAKRALKTDAAGLAKIRLPDAVAVGAEQVVFTLNLADALQPLGSIEGANRDLVSTLMNLVAGKKATFDFAVQSAGRSIPLAIIVQEADENGQASVGSSVVQGIQQKLAAAGFKLASLPSGTVNLIGKSDADALKQMKDLVADKAERIASGIASILSVDDRGADGIFVKVNASISVIEIKTGAILASVTKLVNGRGNNLTQAKKDAFTRLGQDLGDQLSRDLP